MVIAQSRNPATRVPSSGFVFWTVVVLLGALLPSSVPAQASDSTCSHSKGQLEAERAAVGTAFVAGNAELWQYFKRAWWSGEKAKHLFFRADWDQEFRDQDKFGHLYGGYHLTRFGHAALRSVCVSERKAVIASAAYAAFFQLQIEVFDGMYKKYGFSYADMIANTTGQTFAVLQELHPALKAIKPTISYSPSSAMRNRSNFPSTEGRRIAFMLLAIQIVIATVSIVLFRRIRRIKSGGAPFTTSQLEQI